MTTTIPPNGIPPNGWNIFVTELERVLEAHDKTLAMLEKMGVHPQRIGRLYESRLSPKHFAMLNEVELEYVCDYCHVTVDERLRLLAAITAMAVQERLTRRLDDPLEALVVAEQVNILVLDAMRRAETHPSSPPPLAQLPKIHTANLRLPPSAAHATTKDAPVEMLLAAVIEHIERGTLAFHLCQHSNDAYDRREQGQSARRSFIEALHQIEDLPLDIQDGDACRYWHGEAQQGLAAVMELLIDLGVE